MNHRIRIPQEIVLNGLELAKPFSAFGKPLLELSRDEAIALLANEIETRRKILEVNTELTADLANVRRIIELQDQKEAERRQRPWWRKLVNPA